MLPLLSMIRPTDTGVSSWLNNVDRLPLTFVVDGEALAGDALDEPAVFVSDARGQHDEVGRRTSEVDILLAIQRGARDQNGDEREKDRARFVKRACRGCNSP